MSLIKKSFLVVGLIAFILMVDFFLLHIFFPAKKERFLKEMNQKVEASLVKHPPQAQAPAPTESDFKSASEICLKTKWLTYETFPQDLEKTYRVQSKVVDIENFHLKTTDGQTRRIHIVSDGQNKSRTVRLFELRPDGDINPIPLTSTQRQMPLESLIAELKSEGSLFYQQSKERWILGNGATFVVSFENHHPIEFQYFGENGTLSCYKDSCQCL